MKKKNYDNDIRFKVKQRYATISDWAYKTIESERVPEARAKSLYSGAIRIQNQDLSQFQKPSKSIDTKKPKFALFQQSTIQQQSKIYRKFIDPNQITKSLDYSDLTDSQSNITMKKAPQNQKINKQFQAIHNKMKLILDSYKNRERVLLQYIASLQQEINILKQTQNQTI